MKSRLDATRQTKVSYINCLRWIVRERKDMQGAVSGVDVKLSVGGSVKKEHEWIWKEQGTWSTLDRFH